MVSDNLSYLRTHKTSFNTFSIIIQIKRKLDRNTACFCFASFQIKYYGHYTMNETIFLEGGCVRIIFILNPQSHPPTLMEIETNKFYFYKRKKVKQHFLCFRRENNFLCVFSLSKMQSSSESKRNI